MNDQARDAILHETPRDDALPRQNWRELVDNTWLMVAMLFFVTAALGLPLLWISRGFSTAWKVILTIAVLAWTVLILWLFWLVMLWCYTRIADALA
jgi:hypothetical protein